MFNSDHMGNMEYILFSAFVSCASVAEYEGYGNNWLQSKLKWSINADFFGIVESANGH